MKFSISNCMSIAIVIAMTTLTVGSLSAQEKERDREREDRDHERRVRDDFRKEQWRRDFDVAKYLKGQDKNNDGVLAPEEIDGRRTKKFLEQMGIPTEKTSKVEDLVKGYNNRIATKSAEKRKEFQDRLRTIPEFGAKKESFGVSQFGTEDKAQGLQSFDDTATGMKASDFEPEMLKKADKLLGTFDRDKNGFLDGDEISRLSWKSPPPETSDLNRDGRLSKMELAKRFTTGEGTTRKTRSPAEVDELRRKLSGASSGESSKGDSRSQRGDYDSRDRNRELRDRGRGYRDRESRDRDRVRDRRNAKQETPKPNSGSAVAKAKANAQSAQGYAKYVDRSFKKYDSNSDGKLDKKELSASSLLKKAKDSNGDGFISRQEAIALVSGGKIKAPTASPGSKKDTPSKTSDRRMSPVASSPSARSSGSRSTPLSDKDADADGQIQMHEYSDTWTAEKLKEFRDMDKNGDGLLSPTEWRNRKR